ncbi:amino acid racemase [Candidatus Woesearchaeota archaeon]|nr:amino acid racemase [Candidatus Woesearchaeota archaeon]
MGPEATGKYYLGLIKGLQQKGLIRDNEDFPQIVVNSIPAPELAGSITPKKIYPYLYGLRQLEKFEVDAIVMVCNTIHLYYGQLQSSINTPIINLKEKVHDRLIKKNIRKIVVLGTPSTIRKGLYQFSDIECIKPSNKDRGNLAKIILRYNNGKSTNLDYLVVRGIAAKTLKKGAQIVILGCTELAIMLRDVDIPKIDTLDVLVDSTIDFIKYRRDNHERV